MIRIVTLFALIELSFLLSGSSLIENIFPSHRDIVVTGVADVLCSFLLAIAITVKLIHALAVLALFTLIELACCLTKRILASIRNVLNALKSIAVEVQEAVTGYHARFVRLCNEIAQGDILAYDDVTLNDIPTSQEGHSFKNILQGGIFPFEESYYVPAEDPYEQLEDVKRELERGKVNRQVAEDLHKQEMAKEMEKRKVIEDRLEQVEKERASEMAVLENELKESQDEAKAWQAQLAIRDGELDSVNSELAREKSARKGAEDFYQQDIVAKKEKRKVVEERLEQVQKERSLEKAAMETELRESKEAENAVKVELERVKTATQGDEDLHKQEIADEKEKRSVVKELLAQLERERSFERTAIEAEIGQSKEVEKTLKAELAADKAAIESLKIELEREKSTRQETEDLHKQEIADEMGKRKVVEERLEQLEKERNSEQTAMKAELDEAKAAEGTLRTELATAWIRALEAEESYKKTKLAMAVLEIDNKYTRQDLLGLQEENAKLKNEHAFPRTEREHTNVSNTGEDHTAVSQEERDGPTQHKIDLTALKKMFEDRDKPTVEVREGEQGQKGALTIPTTGNLKQDLQDPVLRDPIDDQSPTKANSGPLDALSASSSDERENKDPEELASSTELSFSPCSSPVHLPAPSTPSNVSPPSTSPQVNREGGGRRPASYRYPLTSTPIRYSAARNPLYRGRGRGRLHHGYLNHRSHHYHPAYQPIRRPQDILYQTGPRQRSVLAARDLNRR